MKELLVRFDSIREIEQFVKAATPSLGKILVSEGDRVTNGKSILGLISMGPRKTLTVFFEGTETDYTAFVQGIESYLVTN